MDQFDLNLLVLAALLHDTGKTAQRAGKPKSGDQEGTYCPVGPHGGPTHLHTLYTDYFIENDLAPYLPRELQGFGGRLARLASSHHKPGEDNLLELALSRGDRLSAGTDRAKEQHVDAGGYKQARLISTFDYIRLQGEPNPGQEHNYYPLTPLDRDPFPCSLEQAQQTSYAKLFEQFLDDLSGLPLHMGLKHYTDSLQSLLEKHMWCVPSSTYRTDPDISLFDHAYTTAAIAQSLAVYHGEQGGLPGENPARQKKFLLVGGDLSGIQKHIFGIEKSHGAGVAKILRARSFMLQATVRCVVNVLLEELGLMPQARIMDAGGEFILLLPNTERVRAALPEFEARVQRWFLTAYQGEVSLPLAHDVELTENDLLMESFPAKLNALQDSLQRSKLHRFDSLFQQDFDPVLFHDLSSYRSGACHVCNIHPVDKESSREFFSEYDRDIPICSSCFQQIDIVGRLLPRSGYVIFSRASSAEGVELFDGVRLRLVKEVRPENSDALEIINLKEFGEYAHLPVAGHLPSYTEEDVTKLLQLNELEPADKDNWIWTREEEQVRIDAPKTLNMLAHEAKMLEGEDNTADTRGKALLAGLKADVDNLGMIFGTGLGDHLSISRYSFLSRMFNHFFASYLVDLIRRDYPDIYVVFAGGDDLFFLGPWTDITQLADMISERFAAYTGGNPEVTLSAGISVHKPREPVHGIVHQAETLLERSKHREIKGEEVKNGVTLFGVTVGWERYRELLDKAKWVEDLILREKITMGLASRLLHYADQHKRWMQGDIRAGLFKSHMEYDFKRNVHDRLKEGDETEWQKIELGLKNVQDEMEQLRLPVTWALYRMRSEA
ncbi:MAG: type III-A CRISPR-associated protein Cas10/Csm1 [Desulfohalobiaceae bacterium]|nr:type III-A CRISPR-associated protein Cas10/Csm1 [Desulfohalobiaceae bacterium]